MLEIGYNWTNVLWKKENKHIDNWVKKWGPNFIEELPIVYQYGCFKRALILWKKGKNAEAYKKLSKAFDLNEIKKYFNPDYKPNNDPKWKYSD